MIENVRHFGITVRDLDQSLHFYCKGLGFSIDTQFERDISYTSKLTLVEGTKLRIAIIRHGSYLIELLEYCGRDDRPDRASPVFFPGSAHICMKVNDLENTVISLLEIGATFTGEAIVVPSSPGRGNRVVYGFDPDGIAFELVETTKES